MTDDAVEEQSHSPDWPSVPLGELCEIQGGGPAVRAAQQTPDGVPVVRPADLRHRRISSRSAMVRLAPDRADRLAKYRILAHDILVTRTGTVGRAALVTGQESGWLYGTHLFRVRPRDPEQARYLVAHLSHHEAVDWLERRAAGTTGMRSITLRTLQDLPVPVPPPGRQREIGSALDALDEKIRAYEEVVRATAEVRGTLAGLLLTDRLPAGPTGPDGPA
ncbi:restriction endonuclease subunit S [Streptomyces sp. NPDC003717]|uniref:restriction endonuclease subunit S n=1 Tax=Streptomyces sp. NPDC003717 TaxID=3154276 RepID=UPI0033AF6F55